jgi:hypothetical protein
MDYDVSGFNSATFVIKRMALWIIEPPWQHPELTTAELFKLAGGSNSELPEFGAPEEVTFQGRTIPWKTFLAIGNKLLRRLHRLIWLIAWVWAVPGLFLGALLAPQLLRLVDLANSPYHDWLALGVAVVGGFLVPLLGWLLMIPILLVLAFIWVVFGVVFFVLTLPFRLPYLTKNILSDQSSSQPVPTRYWGPDSCLLRVRNISFAMVAFVAVMLPLAGISYAIYRYVTVVPVDQRLVVISSAGLVLIKTLVIPAIRSALKSKALERLKDFLRGGKDIKKAA